MWESIKAWSWYHPKGSFRHVFWVKLPSDHGSPRRAPDREENASHHNVLENGPEQSGRNVRALRVTRDDIQHHETSYNLSLKNQNAQDVQDFVTYVHPGPHVHWDSEPGVDTVGIYVKNHVSRNRQCFIWIRFDF